MCAKERIRDKDLTIQKILGSAEKVFAKYGFNASSIKMISDESGISDGLILYHYKTNDNIYRAVREKIAMRYGNLLKSNFKMIGLPKKMVLQGIKAVFEFYKNDKTYNRISLWSYLEGENDIIENEAKITAKMVEIGKRLQKLGILKKDIELIVPLTVLIGSIHFWLRYRKQYIKMLDMDKTIKELDELFIKQIYEIMLKGVL
jgi:AcrR family transcriptional regulator